jgi:transcription initiation factor TFIIIB Brf1 subunit/transcription initiation factor TFIIB
MDNNFQILNELKKFLIETVNNGVDKGECQHEEVVTELSVKVCTKCGYEIDKELNYDKEWRFYQSKEKLQGYATRCHVRKNNVKTIHKDLENLGFNSKIINTANELYQKVTQGKIYRGNSRKSIIFACVFSAFKIHGNPQTCENLIRIFNLKRKLGLKGLKYIHLNIEKDTQIQNIRITPYHIISEMMQKFIPSDSKQVEEVHAIYEYIKDKSSVLNRSRPNSTAAGIIYYYILKNKKSITLKQFSNEVELSELTIKKIVKEIDTIYNTKLIK